MDEVISVEIKGAQLLDCRQLAAEKKRKITQQAVLLGEKLGRKPGLAVVRVGEDPASGIYLASKKRMAAECQLEFFQFNPPNEVEESQLIGLLAELGQDRRIDGMMVELPLPSSLDAPRIQASIPPGKDVEGVTPLNLGRLFLGLPAFAPCTAKAAMSVVQEMGINLQGTQAVVVGASNIVGKPLALMLLEAWATVDICHIYTTDLAARTIQGDIVFVCAGVPGLLTGEMVKPGAAVVDIGINYQGDKIVGDADLASVATVASQITPVPGGVGALTPVMLLENVLEAAAPWEK